ncbi:MAG: phage holin family protein [Candidatus Curtissbacteria bacterium]
MRHYLKALIIASIALYAAYQLVPTIVLGGDPKNIAIVIGAILVTSLLIKPFFSLVLLPINFLTLGSIALVLNIALMYILTLYLPGFTIKAYDFPGATINGFVLPAYDFNQLTAIILVAVIITFVQKILHIIFE